MSAKNGGGNDDDTRRDDWITPDDIYNPINKLARFDFDLAASDDNAKTHYYLTEEEDALSFEWTIENLLDRCKKKAGLYYFGSLNAWINPPYNLIEPWIYNAIEGARSGLTFWMMLPNNTDRPWFRHGVRKHSEWYVYGDDEKTKKYRGEMIPTNRINFIDPSSGARNANTKGSVLAIFRPPLPKCWHKGG